MRAYLPIILLVFVYSQLRAQVGVKSSIDSNNILIGKQIHYSLIVKHQPKTDIAWPEINDYLGSFDVVKRDQKEPAKDGNQIIDQREYIITHFDSGQQVIPALKIGYRIPGDTAFHFIETDSFIVQVHTVAVDTSKEIQPISEIKKVPLTFKEIVPYGLGLIGLVALVFAILYYLKKKKQHQPLFTRPKPKLPAHVVALESLRQLEDEKVWQKGEIKLFHVRLTDILRIYIENQYDIPATESTTPEIIDFLKDLIEKQELLEELGRSLALSDMVKFAKYKALPDENNWCLKTAFNFVNETKPALFEED